MSVNPPLTPPCRVCSGSTHALRDFGVQPLTNYFPTTPDETLRQYPLILSQCHACGLIQLGDLCPPQLLKPPRPMHYNEPEAHLDALVDEIVALPRVHTGSRFLGLTYKETTTFDRLHRRGFVHTTRLSAADDFLLDDECAGLETMQARITPWRATKFVQKHGRHDVVIVRHVLEHAHDLPQFALALLELVTPDGYLVFEVPDCTTAFESFDYSIIWEEHVAYFTPSSLVGALRHCGLTPQRVIVYPYALENSLVAVAGHWHGAPPLAARGALSNELAQAERYAAEFEAARGRWHATLSNLRSNGPIALLGAGHLAITFINLLGLESLIDYVYDDAPEKVNRYIPGTQLRISPSSVLVRQPCSVCLLAVAPESEPKVLARNQEFVARGGRFASIFAASDHALKLAAAGEPEPDES